MKRYTIKLVGILALAVFMGGFSHIQDSVKTSHTDVTIAMPATNGGGGPGGGRSGDS
jgi:hypothetical protein